MQMRKGGAPHPAQAGFSMIEMLMTAFVMAIGILGLTLLQAMSLKASRGSKSLATAVLVAEQVMDQVEMEGRLSWLNITSPTSNAPTLAQLTRLRYISAAANPPAVTDYFNSKGGLADPASTDPLVKNPFYTVTTTQTAPVAAGTGSISDLNVRVMFMDNVDINNAPVQRFVYLTRRIIHG